MAIPTILKGDDSGSITFTLDTEHSYTGATLVIAYQGVTRQFTNLVAGGSVNLAFTHDETQSFRIGCEPILVRLVGATGGVETIDNGEWRIKVTDAVGEVNTGGSFAVRPGSIDVPVTDLGDVGIRYSIDDLKKKVNEIIHVLANRTSSLAIAATFLSLTVLAEINFESCAVSNLWSDASVVTNVSGGCDEAAVDARIAPAVSNALATAKAYTDDAVVSAGAVTPSVATNIAIGIVSRDVPEWARSETPPVTQEEDPTVPGWAKSPTPPEGMTGNAAVLTNGMLSTKSGTTITANSISGAQTASDVATAIASSGHMTQAQADASYYPKSQGDAWSSYWDGDDVRVTITNYYGSTAMPHLYLEQKTNQTGSAAFRIVWDEMTRWDAWLGNGFSWNSWCGFRMFETNVLAQIESLNEDKADRAWGFYDSHTGAYTPDAYTVVSSSNIMIGGGMSYQKTITSSAEVWVLTANEPYEPTGVSSNGFFQIKDADGNVQFEIVKGDKLTVGAQANSTTVDTSTTPHTLVVTYNIISSQHPDGECVLDLKNGTWKSESSADCPATVTWSGSSGSYVARITPKQSTDKCFFKATYQRGGDTYINNRCPVGMSKLVLNGTTYRLGTAQISGNTVLTLTPDN